MLTSEVLDSIRRSVLCWLATVDASGQPNVSPKEVFVALDDSHLVIANIASPHSAANIKENNRVCVSMVDIFLQKGFKLVGTAWVVLPEEARFVELANPLLRITQGKFPIRSVLLIEVTAVHPIVAPSYWLFPETTEESQRESALRTYRVRPLLAGN